MKLFHETYVKNEKLAPLVREIGWSHNLAIMEKCKDDNMREFYIRMTRKFGWTKNVLIHQIWHVYLKKIHPSELFIILCKSKQRTIVEYALKESNQPIGVATYQIVSTLPQELKEQLPAPEQIARLLERIE